MAIKFAPTHILTQDYVGRKAGELFVRGSLWQKGESYMQTRVSRSGVKTRVPVVREAIYMCHFNKAVGYIPASVMRELTQDEKDTALDISFNNVEGTDDSEESEA